MEKEGYGFAYGIRKFSACRSSLREEKVHKKAWFLIDFVTGIFRIGKQGETASPGRRKATFAAFSASAGFPITPAEASAAPAESDCVAREGIFARRAKTNLSMCLKRREALSLGRFAELFLTCLNLSAAEVPCKTAPFASFSGRTEKEGPARPERVPISSSDLV